MLEHSIIIGLVILFAGLFLMAGSFLTGPPVLEEIGFALFLFGAIVLAGAMLYVVYQLLYKGGL